MGMRNVDREILGRLDSKSLESQFLSEVQVGLGCSPFEARAVLGVAQEVFGPYLGGEGSRTPPGYMTLVVVDADEPAGKAISECAKRTVCLEVHRGPEDDRVLHEEGARGFRQGRIADLCQEAMSQGGLLTREDLAYRVFFVSLRTVSRDFAAMRESDPGVMLPLRSTRHDIGPVLTHRTGIVRLALEGRTTTEICLILRHSPAAVANYLSTFVRCVQLRREGMQEGQIAFLLRRGRSLVRQYLEMYEECEGDANWRYHLSELLRLGDAGREKKEGRGHRDG